MKIAAVDNETGALNILLRSIGEAVPGAEVRGFRRASGLLEEAASGAFSPDVAFLDIEMPGMSGLELAKRLKDLRGDTNIVFVTGYTRYALDALKLRASGYLLKPATAEKVKLELENLRTPLPLPESGKRVRVQCFGSFEVFVDDKPVAFSRRRAKELFAFFISQYGAASTMAEIAERLWDDGKYDLSRCKQIHTLLAALENAFRQLGVADIIIHNYNAYAVDADRVDCDYYRCLSNDPAAINAYHGVFMAQYAWAEFTAGALTSKYL